MWFKCGFFLKNVPHFVGKSFRQFLFWWLRPLALKESNGLLVFLIFQGIHRRSRRDPLRGAIQSERLVQQESTLGCLDVGARQGRASGDRLKFAQSRPLIFCPLLVALRRRPVSRSLLSIALATRPLASLSSSNLRLIELLLSPDAAPFDQLGSSHKTIGVGRSSRLSVGVVFLVGWRVWLATLW